MMRLFVDEDSTELVVVKLLSCSNYIAMKEFLFQIYEFLGGLLSS